MTDREQLERIYAFLTQRNYIQADELSIRDMVTRYKNPPLTMHFRRAMQMTVNDYGVLETLLNDIGDHLTPKVEQHDAQPA